VAGVDVGVGVVVAVGPHTIDQTVAVAHSSDDAAVSEAVGHLPDGVGLGLGLGIGHSQQDKGKSFHLV